MDEYATAIVESLDVLDDGLADLIVEVRRIAAAIERIDTSLNKIVTSR